jgi:hypothetical protein
MEGIELSTTVVKCSWVKWRKGHSNKVFKIVRRYIYEVSSLYGTFVYQILSYHCIYGCVFCVLLFDFVNYVLLLLCLCNLIVMYVVLCVICFTELFCVLFVCKCVLYCALLCCAVLYCTKLSTQLQLTNISYINISIYQEWTTPDILQHHVALYHSHNVFTVHCNMYSVNGWHNTGHCKVWCSDGGTAAVSLNLRHWMERTV